MVDLGDYWEQQTGNPIPLDDIVIRQSISHSIQQQVNNLICKSVEYSFARYPQIGDFVKLHSQEMEEYVMRQHIDLYVNNYTLDLGDTGQSAIRQLLSVYDCQQHTGPSPSSDIFIA